MGISAISSAMWASSAPLDTDDRGPPSGASPKPCPLTPVVRDHVLGDLRGRPNETSLTPLLQPSLQDTDSAAVILYWV